LSVYIERECKSCGLSIKQHVLFTEKDGKITIDLIENRCPVCKAFIKEPTVGEIRRAKILEEEKESK